MLNQWQIIGNLGKNPEMSYTPNGIAKTSFSVAVSEYKGKDEKGNALNETLWVNVVCWKNLAERCNDYLRIGSKVFVSGKLEQRKYTDKQGIERYWTSLVAFSVEFLSPIKTVQDNNEEPPSDLDDSPF